MPPVYINDLFTSTEGWGKIGGYSRGAGLAKEAISFSRAA
jgi:hypothetical protein